MGGFSPDFNIFEGIRNAMGNECPKCGAVNPATISNCEECGAALPEHEEDEPSISFVQNVGVGKAMLTRRDIVEQVADIFNNFETRLKSTNEVVEKTMAGEIGYHDMMDHLESVVDYTEKHADYFGREEVEEVYKNFNKEENDMVDQADNLLQQYLQGIDMMLTYDGSVDGSPILKGFTKADQAVKKWNEIKTDFRKKIAGE